jgi:hypothetical protein
MKARHTNSWWWVAALGRMLDPAEQEVVQGDLTECGESGRQAFREVLGLVVRRQAALWANWQPWLCLVGLVIPLGMVLSITGRRTTDPTAVYLWMYANNWDWQLLTYRGFWHQLGDTSADVVITYLTLICGSWSAGFVLGAASRPTVRTTSVLLALMLVFAAFVGTPLYLSHFDSYLFGTPQPAFTRPRDPVYALTFYRVFFPLLIQSTLVLLPSLFGMRAGARRTGVQPMMRVFLCMAAITTVLAMVVQIPDLRMILQIHHRGGAWWGHWQGQMLRSFVYWPLVYLLATMGARLLQRHNVERRLLS